jgi:transcriptional regulator with XRE-family HTH domain
MPERSFGRTVRYRRTKLGLSQTQLGELVGRSTATIRAWERDKSRPNDAQVLSALAAVLGVDERHLFDKAEMERPVVEETSPTIEEALATLTPPEAQQLPSREDEPVSQIYADLDPDLEPDREQQREEPAPHPESQPGRRERRLVGASVPAPGYVAPPDPYIQTAPTPSLADLSYVEDTSQRQLYRVRNLATLVASIALFIAFIWALGEGIGALGDWWDSFVGQLRL